MEKLSNGKYKVHNEIIDKNEFINLRNIRDIFRVLIVVFVAGLSILFKLPTEFIIGTSFIMIGWRLKLGW